VRVFTIESKRNLVISGHLDRDTLTKNWWDCLTGNERAELVKEQHCSFDLTKAQRVDSAGLAWLINAIRDGKRQGISVTLVNLPEKPLQLAKISDVDGFLSVE